jgi:hypothetical protein
LANGLNSEQSERSIFFFFRFSLVGRWASISPLAFLPFNDNSCSVARSDLLGGQTQNNHSIKKEENRKITPRKTRRLTNNQLLLFIFYFYFLSFYFLT